MKKNNTLKIIAIAAFMLMFLGIYLEYRNKKQAIIPIPRTASNKTVCQKGEVFYNADGSIIKPDVTYEIATEELSDTPQKTQIVQYVGLEGNFDREIVLKVLELCYLKAKKRTGFQHYNPANSYSIAVCPDYDRAKAHMKWLGKIIQYKNMTTYDVEIDDDFISIAKEPEIEKFGYSVKERKQIFNALANPSKLSKQIIDSIYKKHNLNKAIDDSIHWEGSLKSWAWTYWYK
jgi:hypothetical protein